jgi:uroporphyrinogen decarboxylase
MGVDVTPRYPVKVLEETLEYTVSTTNWGVTLKNWKHSGGTPQFLDFKVADPDAWAEAKKRMTPTRDRVDWEYLKANYPKWRSEQRWIGAHFWFGFDVTHSWMVGTERLLVALVERPEWCVDMFNTYLDMCIALYDMVWEAGYTFDVVWWPDDLGYKGAQFMSPGMYRELLKPVHRRACEWVHSKGAKVALHSCGDVRPFIDDFIEIGVDALNPLEVKAGMDPVAIKRRYGDRLVLIGGINAVLWDKPDAITAEIERVVPAVKQGGGYVFSSDHSVPDSVSLENFRHIIETAKRVGRC